MTPSGGGQPQVGGVGVAQAAPVQTLQPPPTAEFPTKRNENRKLLLIGISALLVTLLVRVGVSAMNAEPEPEGEIVAQLPVGPEGGKTKIDGGGEIKVPRNALAKRETIVVRRRTVPDRIRAVSPLNGSTIVIPAGAQIVYIFSPIDLVFLRPITITLPAPDGRNQGLVFVSANGQIVFVQGAAGQGTVTVRVNSFDFGTRSTFVNRR